MAKFITLQPRRFFLEFRDSHQASVPGGQLAVAALLEQFGLAERVAREPALDPRTHQGKGFAPVVYVTQLLHCCASGGVSLADAERLSEDEPFQAFLGVEKLPDQTAIGEWSRDFVAWALAGLAWNLMQALKLLHLPEEQAPKRLRTLIRHLAMIPVELKRHARQLKACWYAPAGWVAWWRGLLGELLPRCRVLSGLGAGDSS